MSVGVVYICLLFQFVYIYFLLIIWPLPEKRRGCWLKFEKSIRIKIFFFFFFDLHILTFLLLPPVRWRVTGWRLRRPSLVLQAVKLFPSIDERPPEFFAADTRRWLLD